MPHFSPFSHSVAALAFLAAQTVVALIAFTPEAAQATMYKCTIGGKTVYQDKTCPGVKDSQPFKPKNPISTMSSEAFTGKPPEKKDDRPAWLKPMNPVEDCKAKGGKFEPEFRACMLP